MKKRLMMVMCCGIMILGNLSGCNAMKTERNRVSLADKYAGKIVACSGIKIRRNCIGCRRFF